MGRADAKSGNVEIHLRYQASVATIMEQQNRGSRDATG